MGEPRDALHGFTIDGDQNGRCRAIGDGVTRKACSDEGGGAASGSRRI
jgi:hypothetical protein